MDAIVSLTTEQILKFAKATTVGLITVGIGMTGYMFGYINGINHNPNIGDNNNE